ncbi:hypothetical protein VCV18_003346 [Metarhizium anisopliae]
MASRSSGKGERCTTPYMRSLQHLRTALSKKRTRLSNGTLGACLACMYELVESPAMTEDEGGKLAPA